MSKRLNTPLIGVVFLTAFLCGNAYAVKGKYGFSSDCTFALTPLPISLTRDNDGTNATVLFNIFYVRDGVAGMSDYVDFYTTLKEHTSPANTTEEDEQFWPETPYMLKGHDTPVCDGDHECYADDDYQGGYDKGRSKYELFKNDYTAEELKIAADTVPVSGRAYRQYIDVRKLKFLRVEVFTPYFRNDSNTLHIGYTEPLYFEYKKIQGTNNTLKLTSYGTSSNMKPEELFDMLEKEINPNTLRRIYIHIDSRSISAYQGKYPRVEFTPVSDELKDRLPKSCKDEP